MFAIIYIFLWSESSFQFSLSKWRCRYWLSDCVFNKNAHLQLIYFKPSVNDLDLDFDYGAIEETN